MAPLDPSALDPSALGLALLGLALLAVACQPRPREPVGLPPRPAGFERLPYLQAVEVDRATIRWRVSRNARGEERLLYRLAGGEGWREVEPERLTALDRRVRLEGLSPGGRLTYRVVSGEAGAGPYTFRTASPARSDSPVTVLAFGDSGWGSEAQVALADRMAESTWSLAVHVGDLAYEHGSDRDFTVRHFDVYRDLFAEAPFYPAPGNHDVEVADGEAYELAFDGPGAAGGAPSARWYAFRWEGVHFLALDTSDSAARNGLRKRTGEQYAWLVATLDSLVRTGEPPWTVVYTHYPLYSHAVGISGHGPDEELREALEPLFLEHGVDVVLAGHDHHYERSHPVVSGRRVKPGCGPVHLVTGGGGASHFARSVSHGVVTARTLLAHHFLLLSFGTGSVDGRVIGPQGTTLDRFTLLPVPAGSVDREACQ